MRGKDLLIIAGCAVAGYGIYRWWSINQVLNSIRYEVRGITNDGNTILLRLGVLNASNSSLTLDFFNGALVLGNNALAHIVEKEPIAIAPRVGTEILLKINLDTVGIVAEILELILKPIGNVGLRLVGETGVSGIIVPVNVAF
jgi:hypothetical protein